MPPLEPILRFESRGHMSECDAAHYKDAEKIALYGG